MNIEKMTLADHAELWHKECGHMVPNRDTIAWTLMYDAWIEYAFRDFSIISN